jgi:hypothetical protein
MTEQLPSNYAAGLLHLGIREPELSHHTSCTILMLPGVCVKFFCILLSKLVGKRARPVKGASILLLESCFATVRYMPVQRSGSSPDLPDQSHGDGVLGLTSRDAI